MLAVPDLRLSARRPADCQAACSSETRLRCRQFSFVPSERACLLSGVRSRPRRAPLGVQTVLRRCGSRSSCVGRHQSYEKVTGHVPRGADQRLMQTARSSTGGITALCRRSCDAVSHPGTSPARI